ncbi:guanylate kinase [Solimonas aquatica]|uniref:Guanylate kinase n=1 Tax=Solimonas aquatica TaxID=489703 RepID=A0A1H9JZA3_9GAMM|nr:guanylate kinase [Solimonas aquatica]SEQ92033.1 guanylate kinase [Solimonas aquatica]
MTQGSLFIVSAPSGGGKTSLTRALLPYLARHGVQASISVSFTTRAARPGEQAGVHYHFVDEAAFVARIAGGGFLEHAQVFGRRYGTGLPETRALLDAGQDVILDIDWQGARQVRQQWPQAVSIFILPPSVAELERRLRARSQDSEAVIAARMDEAHQEIAHHNEYDYLIVNEDFDTALAELAAVFLEPRLRARRQNDRHAALIAALLAN